MNWKTIFSAGAKLSPGISYLLLAALFVFSSAGSAAEPVPGPISRWTFNEGAGSVAHDSVDGNHGSISGPIWTAGLDGSALEFNGHADRVYCGTGSNVKIYPPLTVEVWLYPYESADETSDRWVVSNGDQVFRYYSVQVHKSGGETHIRFIVESSTPSAILSPPITLYEWHHVVGVHDGYFIYLYIDGELVNSAEAPLRPTSYSSGAPLSFGIEQSYSYRNSSYLEGILDEVAIYDRALTPEEIQQQYFNRVGDSDGDGVNDDVDLCPLTDAGATVDASGCTDDDVDMDGDGICDSGAPSSGPSVCTGSDNCPVDANNGQEDADTDGEGDACDSDDDNDGVPDTSDNCPLTLGGNDDQTDTDMDGAGDICDADLDGDGVDNIDDVCPDEPDPDQTNTDGLADGGDACDTDDDEDGVLDVDDNCDIDVNPLQEDLDSDNIGDACDSDLDGDGVDNDVDNCPVTLGGDGNQTDTDMDGDGDVCDADDDNDTILDGDDNCPLAANTSQADADGDGTGDACNDADDADGDEWSDALDNCPNVANGNQADFDGDLIGDACDSDIDGDGVDNDADDCAATPLGELSDASGCTIAQLCPCDGPRGTTKPWKNHGKYVSCVAHAANDFRDAGLISDSGHGDIVSAAGQSSCGHRN